MMVDSPTRTGRYRRVLSLVAWAHVALFWLCVALAAAVEWRPLGTLDFVRWRPEISWTAPTSFRTDRQPPP